MQQLRHRKNNQLMKLFDSHCHLDDPAFVKSILLELAEVRKEDPEELAGTVWDNTCRLYRISP
jgi:Tat protein secretion system quality control protein TatD with DNase activity